MGAGRLLGSAVLGIAAVEAGGPRQSIQAGLVWVGGTVSDRERSVYCWVPQSSAVPCPGETRFAKKRYAGGLPQDCTPRCVPQSHMAGFKKAACDKTSLGQKHEEPARGCACSTRNGIAVLLPSSWQNPFVILL